MRRRQSKLPPNQVLGGDSFFKPKVQTKLAMGSPGDKYEVEADHMADQVVNKTGSGEAVQKMEGEEEVQQKPLAESVTPLVQKMEASEEEAPVQKMEEEEPVQKMEEEESVQAMEEEEPVQKMEEEEPVQAMEEEEPVQKMEEEEPVQAMEEEEPVQKMEEEEEPVQAKCAKCGQEKESVQAKCAACGKEEGHGSVQTKAGNMSSASTSIEGKLRKGSGGSKMDTNTLSEMESGFGADFSNVNIHNDSEAVQMSQDIGAQAFTHGNDIYFNEGKYNPKSKEGKHLLAHELTHTIQQGNKSTKIQRYLRDTGYRYRIPSTIRRSVREIQAVVGTTPDGIYGINTKKAVENYQRKLKAAGLYSNAITGEWDANTEIAHISLSTGSEAETYNCSGLAFKTFRPHGMTDTKRKLSAMTQLSSCNDKCTARQYKFWYWEYDLTITDTTTGASSTGRDFHIVGGQTDGHGNDPTDVVSKNGKRPVKGPKSPMSWRPLDVDIARRNTHREPIIPNVTKTRTNRTEGCFCSNTLP